jgi:hypothetical protein
MRIISCHYKQEYMKTGGFNCGANEDYRKTRGRLIENDRI